MGSMLATFLTKFIQFQTGGGIDFIFVNDIIDRVTDLTSQANVYS
jgi:hypothetical protein